MELISKFWFILLFLCDPWRPSRLGGEKLIRFVAVGEGRNRNAELRRTRRDSLRESVDVPCFRISPRSRGGRKGTQSKRREVKGRRRSLSMELISKFWFILLFLCDPWRPLRPLRPLRLGGEKLIRLVLVSVGEGSNRNAELRRTRRDSRRESVDVPCF